VIVEYHAKNPLRPGVPSATVASTLGLQPAILEGLVEADSEMVAEGAVLRLASFRADRTPADDESWTQARKVLAEAGSAPPRIAELGIDRDLLHALVRDGELIKISEDFVFLPSLVTDLTEHMVELGDGFTVSEFKDRTGLSRKYAVPFLEWTDRSGLTVRSGDVRRMRNR
jgi:selenocysteine-specific elongation factor